jgi:membrane protein implicated in regulation of membrane protease activity
MILTFIESALIMAGLPVVFVGMFFVGPYWAIGVFTFLYVALFVAKRVVPRLTYPDAAYELGKKLGSAISKKN